MTTLKNTQALAEAGQALPEAMTREQILEMLARAFERDENRSVSFGSFYRQIEPIEKEAFKKMAVGPDNTALGTMVRELNAHGIATDPIVGGVMKSAQVDQDNLHDLVCYCNGSEITGAEMAQRLRLVARGKRPIHSFHGYGMGYRG